MQIVVGQRWTSATEADLGLGVVTGTEGRRLTISFPAAGESRTYAIDGAPLSRIRYGIGDSVRDHDDLAYRVEDLDEKDGLIVYRCRDEDGQSIYLPEIELSAFVQFTTPKQRMLSGQFDRNADFALRVATLAHTHRLQCSPVRGLLGCRTSLLPHQVHIASEVARRHAPRVLLADEVGLGKTIEAGMILHYQLHTHQARRVLIVVPDSLVHQWLVEMLRRFNLRFAIYDTSRLEALADEGFENPFDAEQRVICSQSFLTADAAIREQVIAANWDLVVVDEAHHLRWDVPGSQVEDPDDHAAERIAYACVEALALRSPGILLLTATPEQAGVASHFARLRLLDPARFHDLDAYLQEDAGYRDLSKAVTPLLRDGETLSDVERDVIGQYLGTAVAASPDQPERRSLLRQLLDRHGTGRVLFRNTRAAVPDFPPRLPMPAPLPPPALYAVTEHADIESALYPESQCGDDAWLTDDPRVRWLVALVNSQRLEKFLVICHRMETAQALDRHLTLREGIRSTSFYEGLSIIERDRAAAYFAEGQDDPGGGAQTLVCSEIGSEGRNFQFAHNLVLFDLPALPDLLEQRIGRLDRIGQTQAIRIHIPYLSGTAQEVLYRWYEDGLGIFDKSFAAGQAVYERFETRLMALLRAPHPDKAALDELVKQSAEFASRLAHAQSEGRDRLLELNSCEPDSAQALIEAIEAEESSGDLEIFAGQLFDQYGVDHDHHSTHAVVLRPGERMSGHFPGLEEDGTTVTYSRSKALVREDMAFLSWEHPMIVEAMEMVRDSEMGNSALATMSLRNLPAGTVLLEAWFTVSVVAPRVLQLERYLPLHPTRFVILQGGGDVAHTLPHDKLNALCKHVASDTARQVMTHLRAPAEQMIAQATALAEARLGDLVDAAISDMSAELDGEIERLQSLRKVNPTIREDELEYIAMRRDTGGEFIERAAVRLQALRLVVNS